MMRVCLYLYQLGTCEALHAVMRHSFDTGLSVPELLDFIVLSQVALFRERVRACKRQLQETVCLVFERVPPARDSLPCLRESPRLQETAAFAAPRRTAGRSARALKQVARVPQVLRTSAAQLAHPAEVDFQVVWLISLIKAAA